MIKKVMMILVGLAVVMGCKAMVSIPPSHRDDVAAEAQILADDARNLHGAAIAQSDMVASLAESIADFQAAADRFAVETERGTSEDEIDSRYAALIRAWVRVKLTFPQNKAEGRLKQAYDEVVKEWEKLSRATGYAGKKYAEKYGTK